jgi:hypothetical protein
LDGAIRAGRGGVVDASVARPAVVAATIGSHIDLTATTPDESKDPEARDA